MAKDINHDKETYINQESIRLGFTQSEMITWDECAERWYYSYNLMLERKGSYAMYYIVGDGLHASLDHWYKTGRQLIATLQFPWHVIPTLREDLELRKHQGLLEAMMRQYFRWYPDDSRAWTVLDSEKIIEVEFDNIRLMGKIDMKIRESTTGQNCIVDHKSAANFNKGLFMGWDYRFQFMFYPWLDWRATGEMPDGLWVNAIKKTSLKLGKNESIGEYVARAEADMIQEPEKYFHRTKLPITPEIMQRFEARVLRPKIIRIKHLTRAPKSDIMIDTLARNRNTSACVNLFGQVCQFLPICQNGWELEGFNYTQKSSKHTELELE